MKKLFVILVFLSSLLNAQNNFNRYVSEAAESMDKMNFNGAVEKFSKALEYKSEAKNNYKIADVYIYRGYCRYLLKNSKVALEDMNEALSIKPEYSKTYYFKTLVLLDEKKFEECISCCDKGLEYKPGDNSIMMNKSRALNGLKKYKESNKVLFNLLENEPNDISVIRHIASCYQRQKLWDSSVVYFSKALAINPIDFISYYDRGISKSYLKDYDGAKDDIEKAIQLDSVSKQIGYNNLGFFLKIEQNDFKGAIEYFDKAIALNNKFAFAYSNRGFAKLKLGDIKGAYKDIKKSIELDNTNSYAFKNLALVYIQDGKKTNACENLKKAQALGYTEMYDEEVDNLVKEHSCNK
ncbi:MAG: hypothetical protein H0W61_05280 [Bacteroidetes bacterium]|nr:hypothetical protein [Bacteroidota bacterium]